MATNYNLRAKLVTPQNDQAYRYYLCLIDLPEGDYSNSFSEGSQNETVLTFNFTGTFPTAAPTATYALPIFTAQTDRFQDLTAVQLNYTDGDGTAKVLGGSLNNLRPPVVEVTESFMPGYVIIPSATFSANLFIILLVNTAAGAESYNGKFMNSFVPTFDQNSQAICCQLTYSADKNDPVGAVGVMPSSVDQYTGVYVRYQSDDTGNNFNISDTIPLNYPVDPL